MIRNTDLIEHIIDMLANDAPTTEIAEALDVLSLQSENFDAGIFFVLTDDYELNVKVAGDTTTESYGLAVELLDVINKHLEGLVLKAAIENSGEVQLTLDTDVESVSTAEE